MYVYMSITIIHIYTGWALTLRNDYLKRVSEYERETLFIYKSIVCIMLAHELFAKKITKFARLLNGWEVRI